MSAPVCTVRSARSADLEEHTQQLHDWQLEYDQLDCGRFEGEFLDLRLPGMQLFRERTSRCLRQRGLLSADSVSLGLMLEGQGELVINGVRPGRQGLAVVHDAELEMTSPADCNFTGVVVEAPLLQQAANELLGRPLDLRRGVVLGLVAAADRFHQLVLALHAGLLPGSAGAEAGDEAACRIDARDRILVQIVHVFSDARDADAQGRAAQRKALVDRACRLMLARTDDPPSLDEVCKAVGASPRKLNYCFQDILGMSPNRYVRALRLNHARRELRRCRDASSSVYDVAARWGFWHFGRFSCDYKRQFCESPSQSLRRARLDRPVHA
jgi:AraC family transcriptional regulator, ethanolamine operon transcriptional activator